jgi:hypothetical protein
MEEENVTASNRKHRYTFRLTDEENARFLALLDKSGAHTKTKFILGMLFEHEFRVVTTDMGKLKYYTKLCDYYHQFRGLANNYNQVTKRIHTVFDDRTARYMLKELRVLSATIGDLMGHIFANTEEFKQLWSSESTNTEK